MFIKRRKPAPKPIFFGTPIFTGKINGKIVSKMDGSLDVSMEVEVIHVDSRLLTVKKINSLLSSGKTRDVGLNHLKLFLPKCSDEDFVEWCVSWMQNCCKVDGLEKNSETAVEVLDELFQISANYSELKKSVSFFITTRFFDHFFKCFIHTQGSWSCAASCLALYKGACGQYQETIEKNLRNVLRKNSKIEKAVADCFALLPCLGGGGNEGINYRENWKSQFSRLIKICHSILNSLFIDGTEFQEYNTGEVSIESDEELTVDVLKIQLYNYCNILSSMLLNKYPTAKCVPTDSILELICRGLAITPRTIKNIETAHVIALRKVLPDIHGVLHSLLTATIATCGVILLPYSHVICKLIKQTLEWTDSDFIYGTEKPFSLLRIQTYETMCNWLAAARNGSSIEAFTNIIIPNIISDIQSKKEVTLLRGSKVNGSSGDKTQRRRVDPQANSSLCIAALKTLQFLLRFSGVSLKAEENKTLQEVVVMLLLDVQNSSPEDMLVPYSVPKCRKELYYVLMELVNQPCASLPPPTHFALRIFSLGKNDRNLTVSQFCSSMINVLMNVIHSQFDNMGLSKKSGNEEEERELVTSGKEAKNGTSEDVSNGDKDESSKEATSMDVDVAETDPQNESYDSESSNVSSHEDSIVTLPYTKPPEGAEAEAKNTTNFEEEKKEEEEEAEEPVETEPVCKKIKSSPEKSAPVEKEQTSPTQKSKAAPEPKGDEIQTPLKRTRRTSGRVAEENRSRSRSISSESPDVENKQNKAQREYFLRSKTPKPSSDEQEEGAKTTSSPESVKSITKQTPMKKPRTRASSRLGSVDKEGSVVSKKSDGDDFKDIMEAFDDSVVD